MFSFDFWLCIFFVVYFVVGFALASISRFASLYTLQHYANRPVQYTAIFHGCKNDNFQINIIILFSFLLKTSIVGGSNEYPQSMF